MNSPLSLESSRYVHKRAETYPKSIPKTPETPQIAAPRAQWVAPNHAHAPRAQ